MFITTAASNRIHQGAQISGKDHILILGHTTVENQARIAANSRHEISVDIGHFCLLRAESEIKPERKTSIGNYVVICQGAKIKGPQVGSRVLVGCNCIVEGVIGDCCIVEDDVTIWPSTVIPNFSRVRLSAGEMVVEELSFNYRKLIETKVKELLIASS